MARSISLSGAGWTFRPQHSYINDYLYVPPAPNSAYTNRWWVQSSGTDYVVFFFDWHSLQGGDSASWPVPQTWQQAWTQLASNANELLKSLDRQIKAANDDKKLVVLRAYPANPLWASAGSTLPNQDNPADTLFNWRLPSSTTTNSPWAWFISYLICRYHNQWKGIINAAGPTPTGTLAGNSEGAFIDGISPCNEANQMGWGRDPMQTSAEMIYSTQALQQYYGSPALVLAPDTSDRPNELNAQDNWQWWEAYMKGTLNYLLGWWQPTTYVGWSHHNYTDVRYRALHNYDTMRVWKARNWLYEYNWKANVATDRFVWLTEGGFDRRSGSNLPAGVNKEQYQSDYCEWNEKVMAVTPDIVLWTNHGIRDDPNIDYQRSGFFSESHAPLPWGYKWPTLPG